VRILGFEGSLNILDQAANAMLDRTESSFRGELYEKYYDPQKSSHGDTEDTGNTGEELRKENSKSSSSVSPVSPCEIFLTLPEELGDVHVTVTTARAEPKKEGVSVLQQGDLAIDIARHTVFFGDEEINLFATEFDILKHFLSNPDIVFSREQIIKTIKGSDYPVTIRSVDTQILNLRRKLGRAGNMIETVRGAGYRLRKGSVPMESEKVRSRRFAAATSAGLVVDLHFGHADKFYIYESDGKETKYLETREVSKYCADPECGDKEDRWESVIRALADCEAVLCVKIGPTPEKRLKENGIDAIMTYEVVETAVTNAAKETKRRANYEIA
jgi:DNA-binding winged helix-turn-helix (wHTH) protein